MKIGVIVIPVPTATNFRGASALPYHLIKYRAPGIEMQVWSFNSNGCSREQIAASERELGVPINVIMSSKRLRWLRMAAVRLFLPYPFMYYIQLPSETVAEVKSFLGDDQRNGVWFYG